MGWPVAKELRTAQQLSDMIVAGLAVREVSTHVRKKTMRMGGSRRWFRLPTI
jgi:hypothetical protein